MKKPSENKKTEHPGFKDFCYAHFNGLGKRLAETFKSTERDLDTANMRIHPEVYFSIVVFLLIASFSIPVVALVILYYFNILRFINPLFLLAFFSPPFLVIALGVSLPKAQASNRISGLQIEVPYASMYLSVMVNSGLTPYACLMRLRHTDLLPKIKEEIKRIQSRLLSSGDDPVSVIEKTAKDVGIKEYKDLFLGYASAIKTGGDVIHYIYTQTEAMFKGLAIRIKAVGEIIGTLMETYMIVSVLGTLGLYMIFIVSMTAPTGSTFSKESFFMFAFIVLPIISGAFIYLGDLVHIKYPSSNEKAYGVLAISAPIGIFLATQMFIPFMFPELEFIAFPPFMVFIENLQSFLGYEPGTEPALGLAVSLIAISLPVIITDHHYSSEEKGVLQGITSFLRDITENRKSGLPPEKCIRLLSKNNYGRFSKYLKKVNSQLNWGFSISSIVDSFRAEVKNWLAQINMYLLLDTILVGGGSEASLETLAEFAEASNALEKERKAMLTPLLIIPFIGALLLVVTTTLFLSFFSSMSSMAQPMMPILDLRRILITPLVLHDFLLGLVTGKIVSGRVSSGFKTGTILIILALAGIGLSSQISMFAEFTGG